MEFSVGPEDRGRSRRINKGHCGVRSFPFTNSHVCGLSLALKLRKYKKENRLGVAVDHMTSGMSELDI